jgi:hypothetical protein
MEVQAPSMLFKQAASVLGTGWVKVSGTLLLAADGVYPKPHCWCRVLEESAMSHYFCSAALMFGKEHHTQRNAQDIITIAVPDAFLP